MKRELLSDQAARAIREAILDGTYSPGQSLREGELVSRFAVSSSVIREALYRLQGEGIVVTRPYCGRSVFTVQPEQLEELNTMRASLESHAAYLAAKKMTPAVAAGILAAARLFATSEPTTCGDWIELEMGFHRTVWTASGNEWLARQLNQFTFPIFAWYMLGARNRADRDVRTVLEWSKARETNDHPKGHQRLARAIASGDAKEARRVMLLHILSVELTEAERDMFGLTAGEGACQLQP